jgi:hypothetical protein
MTKATRVTILGTMILWAGACLASKPGDAAEGSLEPSRGAVSTSEAFNPNAEAEEQFNLIARVYRQNGNAVEFYEPEPGLVAISEVGRAGNDFLGKRGKLSVEEVFDQIAPGQPLPEALVDALERSRLPVSLPEWTTRPARPEVVTLLSPAIGGVTTSGTGGARPALLPDTPGSCNNTWFTNTQCDLPVDPNFCTDPVSCQWDWTECLVPWYNGAYGTCNNMGPNAAEFWTSVCADTGQVLLKVTTSVGAGGTWTVDQGVTRTFEWYRYAPLSGHSEVDNALGKDFLFAVNCVWW